MYFMRNIDFELREWALEVNRKPLVLRGARQTGKSSSVREFGKEFELFIELNLERHADLSLVRSCNSARDLLDALSVRHNLERFPKKTLLFIDEIQENADTIGWLRFFKEDYPDLAVVAAGSLMEVRLQEKGFSFPVGRVTFRTLRPFSFFEFLMAMGKDVLVNKLQSAGRGESKLTEVLHRQSLDLLREYLVVGGMPEAVARWVQDGNPIEVRRVHIDLLQALAEDIQKYRGTRDLACLEAAFANLPHHYGQRFKYENFAPGFRSRLMKDSLAKLEGAMLVTRVWPTSSTSIPFRTRLKSAPKLLPLDVGLAATSMGVTHDSMRTLPLDRILDGRLAEIFVGLQLLATRDDSGVDLHFWVAESARANAELDYLLPLAGKAMPIEVKAGASGSLKSLHQFLFRSGDRVGYRFYLGPWGDERNTVKMPDGNMDYILSSRPLYLAETIWKAAL